MGLTRTKEYDKEYRDFLTIQQSDICGLCKKEKIIKEFKYWRILENLFPWNLIAKEQHMIIPKIHKTDKDLTQEEKEEYEQIKSTYIEENYEVIAEATNRKKSLPSHHHIHLIILKD